jgi:hypothetical protein
MSRCQPANALIVAPERVDFLLAVEFAQVDKDLPFHRYIDQPDTAIELHSIR